MTKCNANSQVVYSVKAGQVTRIPVNYSSGNNQPEDSIATRRNKFVAERNDESDLQMHPLLFQAPHDGHFPYYPLCSSASTSSSFNFFAGSPPQLNLSLFHSPHNAAATTAVNFLGKSSKPKESTKSCQADFHPLLQISEGMDSSLVAAHSAIQLSTNLEISEGRCGRVQNPSLTTDKMSCLNISSTSASLKPVSPRQPVAVGSRDVSECAGLISVTNAVDLFCLKSPKVKDPMIQPSQNMAVVPDKKGSEFDSTIHMVVVPSDEGNRESADNIEDHSLPEILMEKEELSDSDDEIGENVEFECEEMADSEAEDGSYSEPIFDIQNEEVEEADVDANFADQLHKPTRFDDSESNASQRGMMDRKVDKSCSNLCLNLNSQPPTSPLVEPENEGLRGSSSLDSKVHSCSSKANENILCINDDNKVAKQVVNVSPRQNSGISSSKKPIKRSSVTRRSLSRGASRRKKHKTEHRCELR